MGQNNLTLDPATERQLCDLVADHCHHKGFTLSDGAVLHLHETLPKEKGVLDSLKRELGPYIDFEGGGLKLYEFNYRGDKGMFTVKPGWDRGGPTIMLQFRMRF